MKRKYFMAIVVLSLLGAGALGWWQQRLHGSKNDLVLYGNIDVRELELAFRQPGRVLNMHVDEGAPVKVGDVLAELDAKPYQDALAAALASVQQAQAEYDKQKRGNRPQDIKRAQAATRQAEVAVREAETEWRRQSALRTSAATSQQDLDSTRAARDVALAALDSARQNLSLQREGSRREDIAAAAAQLAAAHAQYALAQTALEDTRLVSPHRASVLIRVREPGSMVSNRDPVYTLSLRDPVYVRAYVGEQDLGRIAPGRLVRMTTDSSKRVYHGHIGFIAPRAEFTPKSVETTDLRTDLVYRLRIVVRDGDEGLRQGMPVTVQLDNSSLPKKA